MSKAKSNRDEKCNFKVRVECAIWNEWINGLTINHSPTPLPKQEQMQALDVEEMESSSKINLKDVLWWMSIKNAFRFEGVNNCQFFFKMCIFLVTEGMLSRVVGLSLCSCVCHNVTNTSWRRHTPMFVMTWQTHIDANTPLHSSWCDKRILM